MLLFCSVPAPGHFNDDDTPDFMLHLNYGEWPDYSHSLVRLGTSGRMTGRGVKRYRGLLYMNSLRHKWPDYSRSLAK